MIHRRDILKLSALGLIAPAIPGLFPLSAVSQDTPDNVALYRGNAGRTGELPGSGPDPTKPVDMLWDNYAWTAGEITGSPLVVDGVIYVGSESYSVMAFDAETGANIWDTSLGAAVTAPLAIADGVVFTGNDVGGFFALYTDDGRERWSTMANGYAWASGPLIVEDSLFVGGDDGVLYSRHVDGTLRWEFDAGYSISASPAWEDGVVFVGNRDPDLYAVSADTGELLWHQRFNDYGAFRETVAVKDGVVYASNTNGKLRALDATDGVELWVADFGEYQSPTAPAIVDDMVFVGSHDNHVYALDAATGAEIWDFETGDHVTCAPVVADGVLYIGSDDKYLYALDAATGAEHWRFEGHDAGIKHAPTVTGGIVYMVTGGAVYALGNV